MSSRYRAARLGALLLTAATALLVAAPPAIAGTSGEYVGGVDGDSVRIGGQAVPTSLLRLRLDNDAKELLTYCVELDVDARPGARMIESEWSAYPDRAEVFAGQPDKVLWILHNSYPNIDLAELGAMVGADLSQGEAIAGTQAAIWYFSNDVKIDGDNPADVSKLFAYLTGEANTGVGEQPPVSLSITPDTVTDVAPGQKAGPFTVTTTAGEVALTVEGPAGIQIVDGTGQQVQPMDKDIFSVNEFWLTAPTAGAAGEAVIRATALATVETGRLFVGEDNDVNPTQTLIAASSTQTEAAAEAHASWLAAPSASTDQPAAAAPAPQPRAALASTGASPLPLLGIGVLLVGAGAGAMLWQRRMARGYQK